MIRGMDMESELRTVGTVMAVDGEKASVVFKRSKACGDCHACVSFGTDQAETEIENTLGAKVGDRVAIELHQGSVFKASLMLYGMPLVLLLAGVLLGSQISNLAGALIGIGAAALSFVILHLLEPKFKRAGEFAPKMIAVVGHEETETETADGE